MGGEYMRIMEVKSSINYIKEKQHHQQTLIWGDGSVGGKSASQASLKI